MENWDTGVCDCFEDMRVCMGTIFCAVCQLSIQRATLENRDTQYLDCLLTLLCPFCCLLKTRTALRDKYNLSGSIVQDTLISLWCGPCAVAQQSRQMELKGDSPSSVFMQRDFKIATGEEEEDD